MKNDQKLSFFTNKCDFFTFILTFWSKNDIFVPNKVNKLFCFKFCIIQKQGDIVHGKDRYSTASGTYLE